MKNTERDDAIKKLIASKVRQLLRDGETLVSISRRMGVDHTTIMRARDAAHCGLPLMRKFADAYWGGSFDAMVAEATGEPLPPTCPACLERLSTELNAQLVKPIAYPERDKAVKSARELGSVSDAAIDRVLLYTYPDSDAALRIPADEWLDKMRRAERDIRRTMLGRFDTRDGDNYW